MNQMLKLTIPLLLLVVLCTTLSGASAQLAINAEDGADLPDSIPVGETFTVLITDGGSHVGAGTNVVFTLPATGGTPIYVSTDSDGKARYKPLLTGTLGIRVLDVTVTVAEATVTVADGVSELPALTSVDISPETADLVIGGTQQFTAVCNDTSGGTITDDCTLAWSCDCPLVGTIDSNGLFAAAGVGTATVTVTATYNGVTKTDNAVVNVDGSTEQIPVDGDNFTETTINVGTAVINMSGRFNNSVTGNIDVIPVSDPGEAAGYAFTGDGQTLIGLNVTPDLTIDAELADGNGTITIKICYNATEIERLNIDPATLAIWRYDGSDWVKMVKHTPPCVDNGRYGTCVWVELDNLSIFALVGTLQSQPGGSTSSGGGHGTYPPGWGTYAPAASTPAATLAPAAAEPTVAPTVAPAEAPTKAPTAAPTEIETTEMETKGTPGFGAALAVFAIAGLLVAAYLVMRRRE